MLTFEEAAELSTFGSKVVHPAAVLPAWQAGVPMSVRNSMAPEDPGTRIVPSLESETRHTRVAAISSKSNITMIVIKSSGEPKTISARRYVRIRLASLSTVYILV